MIIPRVDTIEYIAIDPGETNGIALYDATGNLLWFGQIKLDHLVEELWEVRNSGISVFIIEEYRVYPQKAQAHVYSQLMTARAIGRIEALSEIFGASKKFQGANIKKIGFKYLGNPHVKTKEQHQWDAHAHGMYFLVTSGVVNASSLLG